MNQVLIFTDLDNTVLDARTYSFDAAREALALLNKRHIPLIICSSKTRPEIEHYRRLMQNNHPFVSENGGGIFIPEGYMRVEAFAEGIAVKKVGSYLMIPVGAPYKKLRQGIRALRAKGFDVKGFGDMSAKEISRLTGLPIEEAAMAKEREFDESFLFQGPQSELGSLFAYIGKLGFNYTRGRIFHLLGKSDKGKAVLILRELFKRQYGDVFSVALGDSLNDLPMFQNVDMPIIVRQPSGLYDPEVNLPNLVHADGIGPDGWNKALLELLKE